MKSDTRGADQTGAAHLTTASRQLKMRNFEVEGSSKTQNDDQNWRNRGHGDSPFPAIELDGAARLPVQLALMRLNSA